jgi:hypothetical protein
MNADRKRTFASPTSSAYSHELTQRVKRLEVLRSDACAHRDAIRIAFIDRQIKNAILEWCDSYVMAIDAPSRREFQVCRSPSAKLN